VPKEGALRQPDSIGDLGRGGLVKPALAVQLERGLRKPASGVGTPATHGQIIVLTATDITNYSDGSD